MTGSTFRLSFAAKGKVFYFDRTLKNVGSFQIEGSSFCVQQGGTQRDEREGFRKAPKVKIDIRNPKIDFHIDADCLCAVVTMSSEHDQQDLKDKESVETMEISRYTWNQILQNMKEKSGIRDITFNTWLNPLRYYSVKDNTVIIMVPTGRTGVDYYSKKYLSALKASIQEITGIEYEVRFMPNIVLM